MTQTVPVERASVCVPLRDTGETNTCTSHCLHQKKCMNDCGKTSFCNSSNSCCSGNKLSFHTLPLSSGIHHPSDQWGWNTSRTCLRSPTVIDMCGPPCRNKIQSRLHTRSLPLHTRHTNLYGNRSMQKHSLFIHAKCLCRQPGDS